MVFIKSEMEIFMCLCEKIYIRDIEIKVKDVVRRISNSFSCFTFLSKVEWNFDIGLFDNYFIQWHKLSEMDIRLKGGFRNALCRQIAILPLTFDRLFKIYQAVNITGNACTNKINKVK